MDSLENIFKVESDLMIRQTYEKDFPTLTEDKQQRRPAGSRSGVAGGARGPGAPSGDLSPHDKETGTYPVQAQHTAHISA